MLNIFCDPSLELSLQGGSKGGVITYVFTEK